MANLKINTDAAIATANKIKNLNNQIRDDFKNVQTAINKLASSWDGSAAENSIKEFNSIKTKYCDARYKVMDNYVGFLHKQVGENYAQAEETNKSLADAFK